MNFRQALTRNTFVDQGTEAMNALVFGAGAHPNVVKFIRNQQIPTAYARLGEETVQAIQANVINFMGEGHRAMIEELENSANIRVGEYERIRHIEQAQHANPTMIRVVMANPQIAAMYEQGLINGYADVYERPSAVGLGDPLYNAIVDDMAIERDGEWEINHTYCNRNHHGALIDDEDDDVGLSMRQKIDAIQSWNTVLRLIAEGGQDPTSPIGEML